MLRQWKLAPGTSHLPFLPFPTGATIYSEGQLYTPFAPRKHGDQLAEAHTHADGIAGDFSIGATKSGIEVHADCRYLALFEAKLYSRIAGGTSHAPGYDQVSRTMACVINTLLRGGCPGPYAAHVVVLYPADNVGINPATFAKPYLEHQIAKRVLDFGLDPTGVFARGWRAVLDTVQLSFVTWEDVLAEIGGDKIEKFYDLCQRFNR